LVGKVREGTGNGPPISTWLHQSAAVIIWIHDWTTSFWSPNPRVHAILPDKRNLALLSSLQALLDRGLTMANADCLEDAVPKTWLVSSEDATALWSARRQLF